MRPTARDGKLLRKSAVKSRTYSSYKASHNNNDSSALSEFDPLGKTTETPRDDLEEDENNPSLIDLSNTSLGPPSPTEDISSVVFLSCQDVIQSQAFRFRRTYCVSLFRYNAAVADEINLQRGDILEILGLLEQGWIVGRKILGSDGHIVKETCLGVLPSNYVKCFQFKDI